MKEFPRFSRQLNVWDENPLLRDVAFNRHSKNDGNHNSPYNEARIDIGLDNIRVELTQGINEEDFKKVAGRAVLSTTGIDPDNPPDDLPWDDVLRGGLQQALETQVIVFDVWGVDRTCTHQVVRSRAASFGQQSQRATFMGNTPNVRMPESIWRNERAREAWLTAVYAVWEAYSIATDEDISYQDARSILIEGTETYIQCRYTLKEFMNVYAYRACSMFNWQICHVVREMKRVLVEAHPWVEPFIKISCQTGGICDRCEGWGMIPATDAQEEAETEIIGVDFDNGWGMVLCPKCGGSKRLGDRCTFQGWESPEGQCPFPWAKDELRTYMPAKQLRIGH